jgi:DNA repair exonuclease SbcCD ATPase subunit
MEISGAEQAIIEFSEQLAAWKIKYYVSLYRQKFVSGRQDEEKKNLIRQLKLQKKKIQSMHKEHSDHLELHLEERNETLVKEKEELESVLSEERDVIRQLRAEITELSDGKWTAETELKRLEQEHLVELERKMLLVQQSKDDLAYAKEELEISRRTAQDYSKSIHGLEGQLTELSARYEERIHLCDTQHQERDDGQAQKKIEGLSKEVYQLNSQVDALTQTHGEDQREVATLKNTILNLTREVSVIKKEKSETDALIITVQSDLYQKNLQITSLEKLITELTVQRDRLGRMAEDGTNTTEMINSDLQRLMMVIEQKSKEIASYQRAEEERNRFMATADSRVERLMLDSDRYGLIVEDQYVQNKRLLETIDQNNVYTQLIESQLNAYRKRDLLSQQSSGSPMTGSAAAAAAARAMSPLSHHYSSHSVVPELRTFSLKEDPPLGDESFTETLHPLEGKLVNLLSLLEEKLTQLDSVVRQVDGTGGHHLSPHESGEGSGSHNNSQSSDATNESQLEELCSKLESMLMKENEKLNDLKAELTTARHAINISQAEKEKLVQTLQKLPTEKSHRRKTLSAHVEKLQIALQERLVEAQNVATEALNCKMECDRLREELTMAEEALEEIKRQRSVQSRPPSRSKPRPPSRSQEGRRQSSQDLSHPIQEDSNDDAGFMTPTGGGSSLLTASLQDDLPVETTHRDGDTNASTLPARPKAKKQFSELDSNNLVPQSPLQLHRKVSAPVTPQTIGKSEVYQLHSDPRGGLASPRSPDENQNHPTPLATSKQGSNQSLGRHSNHSSPSDTHSNLNNNNHTHSSYFSSTTKRMSVTPSDQSLSKIESPLQLLRMIQSKLHATHQLLTQLQTRKEASRAEIEKWTLFFLREHGRVPGLAESKYGPSNQIFETFNKVQHEIYSCHYEVQELFDHLDSRRQEILRSHPSLNSLLEDLDAMFLDPLLSQHDGEEEEYEDAYKLHFDSVETMLLQVNTDSEEVSIHSNFSIRSGGGIFPTGLMDYERLDDLSKVDVLQNIENDIKEFQQDLDELKQALHDSREVAEELNHKVKSFKSEIQSWSREFRASHGGNEPTQDDKEREMTEVYTVCHETHLLLEEELDKMKTFALISSAKATEIDRLKVIFRKFLRSSSPTVAAQFQSSSSRGGRGGGMMSSQNSSASLQSSQSLFHSLSDRLGSILQEDRNLKPVKKTSSMESDSINSTTYPSLSETPEQDLVKLTDDLEMLRAYFAAAETDLGELKERKGEIKSLMKSWEEEFIQTNQRKPTREERKTLMEDMYEEYQAIQEELAEILEQREKGLKMKLKIEYLLELRMKQISSRG